MTAVPFKVDLVPGFHKGGRMSPPAGIPANFPPIFWLLRENPPSPYGPQRLPQVPATETRHLRHVVLRPHQRPEELVYPGDDAPDTVHFGLYVGGKQHGVASLYRESQPGSKATTEWRLRGMAVLAPDRAGASAPPCSRPASITRRVRAAPVCGATRARRRRASTGAGLRRGRERVELPGIGPTTHVASALSKEAAAPGQPAEARISRPASWVY